jgi:hypothetical protein
MTDLDELFNQIDGGRPELQVNNAAVMAEWLREQLGTGPLAGMFYRSGEIVFTPRESEDGYVPLSTTNGDHDGPSQIRPVKPESIAARVQYRYNCFTLVKQGDGYVRVPALFPTAAARTAYHAPDDMASLRVLHGVVHAPTFRPDGSIIETPGYDETTRLLFLPEPGLAVQPVPPEPTRRELSSAVELITAMIQDFPFVSDHHRANYHGYLLTPLLRTLVPPPYKLCAIEAHQPGSGKTLLANLGRIIHGGVFRSEIPDDDAEVRKQITSILSVTTGAIVVFDNVTGQLDSSTLAGLLTSDRWDDRPLGVTDMISRHNDRLWTITGNNLRIGGDLPRRTLRIAIDPNRPNPELRTGFGIANLEDWVRAHRGALLWALLVIARSWIVAGQPVKEATSSDGFARWIQAIRGILTNAEIKGVFDHVDSRVDIGDEDEEWRDFLAAIYKVQQDETWTVRDILGQVDADGQSWQSTPIPLDAVPGELADRIAKAQTPHVVAKSLGKWLSNREGRWVGRYTVRKAWKTRDGVQVWQIETKEDA